MDSEAEPPKSKGWSAAQWRRWKMQQAWKKAQQAKSASKPKPATTAKPGGGVDVDNPYR